MATIDQSSVDIINVVQQAQAENRDVYVTKRGQVKVNRGIAGWWATRNVKTAQAKDRIHKNTIDKFADALIRESLGKAKNDPKTNTAFQQSQTLPLLIRQITRAQAVPSLTVNALIEARELTSKAVAADGHNVQPLLDDLKTGKTLDAISKSATTASAQSQGRDTTQAKARLNQDIAIITSALTKEEIDLTSLSSALAFARQEAEQGVEGATERVTSTEAVLTQKTAEVYELRGALGVLNNLSRAVADEAKRPSSTVLSDAGDLSDRQTLSAAENVGSLLSNVDDRLSRIEHRAGVTLSGLSESKQQAFVNFLTETTFDDYQIPGSLDPNITDWRNRDIDDARAVQILKFVSTEAFTEDFAEEVEQTKAKAVQALNVLAELANKDASTLTEQERVELSNAFRDYTSVVSDDNALQTYFRFGRTDDQPTAPLEIKKSLTERLGASLSSDQKAQILLGLSNSDSVINSLKALEADYKNDPSSKEHLGDPSSRFLVAYSLSGLIGSFSDVVAGAGAKTIDVFDEAAREHFLQPEQAQYGNGERVAGALEKTLTQQASRIQLQLAQSDLESYQAALRGNSDYDLSDTQFKNTVSAYYLSLALQGQTRAGERVNAPRGDEPAIKFTVSANTAETKAQKLQGQLNEVLKNNLSTLKALTDDDDRSITLPVDEDAQIPLATALSTANNELTSQALGTYKGQSQTLYFGGGNPDIKLTATSEGQHIRLAVRRTQEVQSFSIEANGPQLNGGHYRPASEEGNKRAQAEEIITFTIDKESLKNDSYDIVPNSVDVSVDFYVPITADHYL